LEEVFEELVPRDCACGFNLDDSGAVLVVGVGIERLLDFSISSEQYGDRYLFLAAFAGLYVVVELLKVTSDDGEDGVAVASSFAVAVDSGTMAPKHADDFGQV
jgi:hypothetical protein